MRGTSGEDLFVPPAMRFLEFDSEGMALREYLHDVPGSFFAVVWTLVRCLLTKVLQQL